jgi:hypothetical protein
LFFSIFLIVEEVCFLFFVFSLFFLVFFNQRRRILVLVSFSLFCFLLFGFLKNKKIFLGLFTLYFHLSARRFFLFYYYYVFPKCFFAFPLYFHLFCLQNSKRWSLFFYFLYFLFSIFFFQFFFKKNQQTIYVHTHVIFWEFGLHFSNLHINVYHVFDADFE